MYNVVFKPSIEKDLKSLPKHQIQSILSKVATLANEPFPYNSVKLTGTDNLYRIRVGDYRVIYSVDRNYHQVVVHYVRHRREVYRGL